MKPNAFRLVAGLLSAGLLWSLGATAAAPRTLSAPRATAPVLDGRADDVVWETAGRLVLRVNQPVSSSGVGDVDLVLRALRTERRLYLSATWADPTPSVHKARWLRRDGTWVKDETQDEDRLSFIFDTGRVAGFARKGCQVLCHTGAMATNGPTERVDVWEWRSSRTSPAAYADDQWWTEGPGNGRRPDAGRTPGPETNAAGGRPKYVWAPTAVPGPFLYRRDAVLLTERPDADTLPAIPGYVIDRATGSRGDVDAVAGWRDGRWTVELARDLDTGQSDDFAFVPGATILFSVAIFENLTETLGHGNHGRADGPFRLALAP